VPDSEEVNPMPVRFVSSVFACLVLLPTLHAGGPAQVETVRGALLTTADGKTFRPLAAGAGVPAGQPLLALFQADLRSANGAIVVRLRSDLGEVGPLPSLESVARINNPTKADLDVTLDRGVIVLRNMKPTGAAYAMLHIRGEDLKLKLDEPGTKLGVEVYGRHAPGPASLHKDEPVMFVFCVISEGSAELSHGEKTLRLKAPPGPAFLRWDSIFKTPELEHLQTLPAWAHRSPEEVKTHDRINVVAESLTKGDPAEEAGKMVKSIDPLIRKAGIVALGGMDRLDELAHILGESKQADVRDEVILVLRQWLGRQPGQIKIVEDRLAKKGITGPQAESVVQLLLGFDEPARARPETYAMLIGDLDHPRPTMRALAHWHLVRLVPAGKAIPYDPTATEAERRTSIDAWRRLVPPGKLPTAPKR
jgi:hypothetical protein